MRLRENHRNAPQAQPAFPLHLHHVTMLKVHLELKRNASPTPANMVISMLVPYELRNADKSAVDYDSYASADTSSTEDHVSESIIMSQEEGNQEGIVNQGEDSQGMPAPRHAPDAI